MMCSRSHERDARSPSSARSKQLPDDALFDAHCFPWTDGKPLAVAIAGDTYEHYPEHIRNIQRWRAVRSIRGIDQ